MIFIENSFFLCDIVEGTNEISSKVFFQETLAPNPPVQQVHLIPIMAISSHHPEPGICPYCHQIIVTRIKKKNGLLVWLASAGICFLGFALGCCLIPWFLDGLKV